MILNRAMFRKLPSFLLTAVLALTATPSALFGATEAFHLNVANITDPADSKAIIDATAVLNRGTFDFTQNHTTQPWDTSNTRYFTNGPAGPFLPSVIKGLAGFRFDFAPSFGPRQPSAVFNNIGSGLVQSSLGGLTTPDYVLVNATNIYNQGQMSVSANGLLRYDGTNMDFSKGGLEVRAIEPKGTSITPPSQQNQSGSFTADYAIYDNFWALNQQIIDLRVNGLLSGSGTNLTATTPQFQATPQNSSPTSISVATAQTAYIDLTNGTMTLTLTNLGGITTTNVQVPTNIVRQAVFVGGPDPSKLDTNFALAFKSTASPDPSNPSSTVMVEITTSSTNVIDPTKPIQTTISIKDTMVGQPSFLFLPPNDIPRVGTARPSNFSVSRQEFPEWQNASSMSSPLTNGNFYYDGNIFTNPIVRGIFSVYGFSVDNVFSGPSFDPSPGFTNLPGRVEIHGASANLSQVRVRAEGAAVIDVDDVLSTSNAVVDCQSVSYKVGAKSGNLSFKSLVQPQVYRVNGDVSMYSLQFVNSRIFVNTNYNTNPPPNNFNLITNICPINFHYLVIDRSALFSKRTMVVHDLQLTSANTTFADTGFVEDSLTINGDSFTLTGLLTLTNMAPAGSLNDFGAINAPALRNFTNFGTLLVTNVAAFGSDTLLPYDSFYNRGTIGAYAIQVASSNFDTANSLGAAGSIAISAGNAVFNKGTNFALGDVQIWAGSMNLNQAQIIAGGALVLTVTNALSDNGATAPNLLKVTNGLALTIKPTTGDLVGTTIDTFAQMNQNAYHVWAGADLGANGGGFQNNVSIGRLVLRANPKNGLLVFQPAGAQNAMYVSVIDLSNLSSYTNQIRIDPGMTIYFRNSFGVPPDQLNGKFNGRMVWVTSNVVASQASLGSGSPPGLSLTWNAAAGGIYSIQTTTNIVAPVWQTLMSYTNNSLVTGSVTVLVDPNAPAGNFQRYYRVNYGP
jgi:hypothetical protein